MRNETVERIVNLLFQDVEMTDEVQALYDETMSNCQERYQDMTSRGLSDDDAIAAVVESLKGMEDVISQYPKKSEAPEAEEAPKSAEVPVDDDGDGEQTDFTFHPADIEDGILRVCRDPDAPKRNRSSFTVSGSFANGRLYVKKPNGECFFFGDKKSDKQVEAEAERHAKEFEQHAKEFSDNMSKMGFQQEGTGDGKNPNSIESMIDSFASTASRFGQELGKLFSSIKPNITVSRSIGDVTLCIPRIFDKPISVLTTSGDIEARDIHVTDLNFTSTSGDISITGALSLINGSTTSGDIDVELPDDTGTNNIDVHSRSGDISMRRSGRRGSRTVTGGIRSVSGDIEIR